MYLYKLPENVSYYLKKIQYREDVMTVILGCRKCRPTGRRLAEALGARYVEEGRINTNELVIRYGNGYSADSPNMINKQEAVALSSNKPRCKEFLIRHNIRTPKYYSWQDVQLGRIPFPIIARRNNHSQGRWFYLINSTRDLRRYSPENHYLQELVNKKDEYRLFLMKDPEENCYRIIEADLKVPPESDPHAMIRNHTHGSFFRWIRVSSLDRGLKENVKNAVEKIGLDFAAVDASTIYKDGQLDSTIFEVNSAPGLIPRKIDLFVSKIRELYPE